MTEKRKKYLETIAIVKEQLKKNKKEMHYIQDLKF